MPSATASRLRAPLPDGPVRRWWRRLTRPLWSEPPEERSHRRGRLMITGPCGAVVGLAFGVLAVGRWGLPPLPIVLAGATGGFLVTYLMGQVESLARAVARVRAGPASFLIRVGADVVAGALLGRLLAAVLEADAIGSLAAGASLLVAYSAVATRLFWGGWVEGAVHVLTGQGGQARRSDYSFPASLAARGLFEEAHEEYEAACRKRPGHPDPMLHAAWTLRGHRRWEEALAWYRRALASPRIDAPRAAAVVRQVWEIQVTKLDDPAGCIPDLSGVVARFPDAEETSWARSEVQALMRETGQVRSGGAAED